MVLLMNAPVVVKILISLAIILVGNRIFKNLSISLIGGIVVLALWSGHSLRGAGRIAWDMFSSIDQIFLYIVIFLVIGLSTQMKKNGTIDRLVTAVQSRMNRRAAMAVLPALIGLLPMPGGAIFSAPLVDSCDTTGSTVPMQKSRINFWFRHLWEYWWPLYPGVLLAVSLAGVSVLRFSTLMFPMTLVYVFWGWFFLLRKVHREEAGEKKKTGGIIEPLLPVLITVGVYILVTILFPFLREISNYLPMIIGIITAISVLQIRHPLNGKEWKGIILAPRVYQMIILVILIRIYGGFIEAPLPDGVYLMEKMREELFGWGVPIILFTILIPFFSGIATGIAIGTVGASMPIVISLMGPDPSVGVQLSTILLAFSCGHMGMMISPVHICLLVTNEYYETGVMRSLKGLLLPSAGVLLTAFLISRLILLLF